MWAHLYKNNSSKFQVIVIMTRKDCKDFDTENNCVKEMVLIRLDTF